jgi:hypothetical protein
MSCTIQTFPTKIKTNICSFLNQTDETNLGLTCKTFQEIIRIKKDHNRIGMPRVNTYKILKLESPKTKDLLESFSLKTKGQTLSKTSGVFFKTFVDPPKKVERLKAFFLAAYNTRLLESSGHAIKTSQLSYQYDLEFLSNRLAWDNKTDEALEVALKIPTKGMDNRRSRNRAVECIAKVLEEQGQAEKAFSVLLHRILVRSYHASDTSSFLENPFSDKCLNTTI